MEAILGMKNIYVVNKMFKALCTLYLAAFYVVSRKMFKWECDLEVSQMDVGENLIHFNRHHEPTTKTAHYLSVINNINDTLYLSKTPWPSLFYDAMFCFGTISSTWNVLVFFFSNNCS